MNTTLQEELTAAISRIVAETNGINMIDTLALLQSAYSFGLSEEACSTIKEFDELLRDFLVDRRDMDDLLDHPFAQAFSAYFSRFPIAFREEHTHLTGALTPEFIFPRLREILDGPNGDAIHKQLLSVYGEKAQTIDSPADVAALIQVTKEDGFDEYLDMLFLAKVVLVDKQAHADAAYNMAKDLYAHHNVGSVRVKFTFSRANTTSASSEDIPGSEEVTPEDSLLGLYEGFKKFQDENPVFEFILAPSFRKEANYYDSNAYASKKDHMLAQVNELLEIIERNPQLRDVVTETDTLGSERNFFRKRHFMDMKHALRKLQYHGFQIRSHHGETWATLRQGIQAVDNAMNIWHVDAIEHGVSMGVNPNYYFQHLYQRILELNEEGTQLPEGTAEYAELQDMDWNGHEDVRDKLLMGTPLTKQEQIVFTKVKFHTAREVEHYQHDILNRIIDKGISLVALPSSNYKLTSRFVDYKDHPFSWWEKKGMKLGIGTDNYVTLNTNFITEMLILLFTDARDLKITKLLMVATGENRRPFMSSLLWEVYKDICNLP